MSVRVRPLLRVVANGIKNGKGRLTLIATPQHAPDADQNDPDTISLAEWPGAMAKRLAEQGWPIATGAGKVWSRRLQRTTVGQWEPHEAVLTNAAAYEDETRWQTINSIWQKALAFQNEANWTALAEDIARSLEGKTRTAVLAESYPAQDTALDPDGAMVVPLLTDSSKGVEVTGVVSIPQSDIAIEEEGVRAARILRKLHKSPSAFDDSDDDSETLPDQKYSDTFAAAANSANPERRRTRDVKAAVEQLLQTAESSPATSCGNGASTVPTAAAVLGEDDVGRRGRRGNYQYANWLQRSLKMDDKETPIDAPEAAKVASEMPAIERIRGTYFALQGDPTLSRLFCLAIDIEVDTLPAGKMHLLAQDPEASGAGLIVATAALSDKKRGFWPVSIFEAFMVEKDDCLTMLNEPALVEQRHGVWRLGTEIDVDVMGLALKRPRMLPVSLQLRRALDSKTRDRDRGEQHSTAGFNILDRDRAGQIARELAVAGLQADAVQKAKSKDGPTVLVLHAEELTVGRCIDVAAASPGADSRSLNWRALTRRLVDFDFGKNDALAEQVLADLFPGRKGGPIAEEVGFQVASRMMPVPGATEGEGEKKKEEKAKYEIVADEAIYQWDGTPGGVLTDSLSAGRSDSSQLPFGRTLDLPHKGLVPLRFGTGYQFRIRSKFLGGGSPDCVSDETGRATHHDSMVPAATRANEARPRRFLRQEPIAAPTALMPVHLAAERMANMGFEQIDVAIVRSSSDAPADDLLVEQDQDAAVRGLYETPANRAVPEETMRVFIAPEVAQDVVVRHGELDKGNPISVRRGGLQDVRYWPAELSDEAKGRTETRPSGFPIIVTRKRDTMEEDGAIYECEICNPRSTTLAGTPIFAPGNNETGSREIGYLPDPAAHHFSVRCRIPGSDCYLAGNVSADLYSTGQVYPHALPLAIRVVRDLAPDSKRPRHPGHINDIASAAKVGWLGADGRFSTKSQRGAKVQLIEITLLPGQEYQLEVSCLPDAAMLARCFAVPETVASQMIAGGTDVDSQNRLCALCGDAVAKMCFGLATQHATGLDGQPVADMDSLALVAQRLLDAMEQKWPIEELAAVTSLRVAHAINKPAEAAEWLDGEAPASFRVDDDKIALESVLAPAFQDALDAKGMMLDGKVALDLQQIGSFQVIATTAVPGSEVVDDDQRGRSALSKRSGRWPLRLQRDGTQSYVGTKDLVGFDVARDGQVTLPKRTITLLSVSNLPTHGAVGRLMTCEQIKGAVPATLACRETDDTVQPILAPGASDATTIRLGPLFAAAASGAPIRHRIALPPGAEDVAGRFRDLKIERPDRLADTRARELELRLVAVSRHAGTFETEPTYLKGKEQALLRRQPLKRQDQAVLSSQAVRVWVKSTARPSMPDLRRPELSFRFKRQFIDGKQVVTRDTMVRIYMGRGWYSSGEGERLGVVLWPPNLDKQGNLYDNVVTLDGRPNPVPLPKFEDADLGNGGPFVTRWGGDPIRKDPVNQEAFFIPSSSFVDLPAGDNELYGPGPHRAQLVRRASIPVPLPRAPGTLSDPTAPRRAQEYEYLEASLITYEPAFDLDREEWYVDICLSPDRASEPFVRFGLVRYQEHSIDKTLKVSEPVTTMIQLLPKRRVEVDCAFDEQLASHQLTVTVRGFASLDIKRIDPTAYPGASETVSDPEKTTAKGGQTTKGTLWAREFEKLRQPKVRVTVFHETQRADGGLARLALAFLLPKGGKQWSPAAQQDAGTTEFPDLTWSPKAGEEAEWTATCSLPSSIVETLEGGQLVAYLEEYDKRMPSSYRTEPVAPDVMFSEFVDSGPRFSARVPFMALTDEASSTVSKQQNGKVGIAN